MDNNTKEVLETFLGLIAFFGVLYFWYKLAKD